MLSFSDRGQLFACGNGRHGKLGLIGVDDCSNQFVPTLVSRFNGFQVQQVMDSYCYILLNFSAKYFLIGFIKY